jgi:hypothetical protein
MPPTPRWALVAPLLVVLALFAGTAVGIQPVSAEGPTGTSTPSGTVSATATSDVTFEVTPEGLAVLKRVLASRWLPRQARVTLAAILEQAGVEHSAVLEAFQKRQGEDKHQDRKQLCERILAAADSPERLSERCRELLAKRLRASAAATATATPRHEPKARLHEAMSAFFECMREHSDDADESEGDRGEALRECAAEVKAEFGIAVDTTLPAFKASIEGEKRGLRGVRLDGPKAKTDVRLGVTKDRRGHEGGDD